VYICGGFDEPSGSIEGPQEEKIGEAQENETN
jgi:hypothetical protein